MTTVAVTITTETSRLPPPPSPSSSYPTFAAAVMHGFAACLPWCLRPIWAHAFPLKTFDNIFSSFLSLPIFPSAARRADAAARRYRGFSLSLFPRSGRKRRKTRFRSAGFRSPEGRWRKERKKEKERERERRRGRKERKRVCGCNLIRERKLNQEKIISLTAAIAARREKRTREKDFNGGNWKCTFGWKVRASRCNKITEVHHGGNCNGL